MQWKDVEEGMLLRWTTIGVVVRVTFKPQALSRFCLVVTANGEPWPDMGQVPYKGLSRLAEPKSLKPINDGIAALYGIDMKED